LSVSLKKKEIKTLLTKREQASRWIEHFNEVLNQPMPDDLFDFTREKGIRLINATQVDITEEKISKSVNEEQ